MKDEEFRVLKESNPIIEVARELGIKFRNSMGECFYHDDHDGSEKYTLFFDPARNTFFCKVCNIGGNVFDLVCRYKGWSEEEAIEWLKHRRDFDHETRLKCYMRSFNKP